MRAFKQIELIQAVIKARSIKDDTIRTSMILKNSSFTLWLVFDFVSWLHFAKVIESTPEFSKYIGDLANRFWLAGLLCSLAGNLYKLSQNQRKLEMEIKAVKYAASKNDIDEGAEKAIRLLKGAFGDIVNATVHDAIECTIPALGLELLPSIISPTIVALAATATSITGGISLWTSL